jgi:hypothetical protein
MFVCVGVDIATAVLMKSSVTSEMLFSFQRKSLPASCRFIAEFVFGSEE